MMFNFWQVPGHYTNFQNSTIFFGYFDSQAKIFLILYPLLKKLNTLYYHNPDDPDIPDECKDEDEEYDYSSYDYEEAGSNNLSVIEPEGKVLK